jgi:hypothetical protein
MCFTNLSLEEIIFDVLTAANFKSRVFSDVLPYSLADKYQHVRGF